MFSGALQQQIYREQGNHYQRLGRHDSAIEAYKKSLELNPEIIESAYRLAESQLIMVHPDEALNGLKAKFGLGWSKSIKSICVITSISNSKLLSTC